VSKSVEFPDRDLPELTKQLHDQEIKQKTKKFDDFLGVMQNEINGNMRAILVDWLVDVSVHFEVMSDTLHLAVGLIDRYLATEKNIARPKLQLVGVACMKIADMV